MTDVRSMLRAERAARSQQQPRKPSRAAPAAAPPPASKKRKAADDEEELEEDARKRARGPSSKDLPADFFDVGESKKAVSPPIGSPSIETTQFTSRPAVPAATAAITAPSNLPSGFFDASNNKVPHPEPQAAAIDEDEWAAFERDVASPAPDAGRAALAAINSSTAIEAKPMTAEELAAQARKEQSAQRGVREAELEAEKEDAARQLEDEFDEMEQLEDRVRKLREKREALRSNKEEGDGAVPAPEIAATEDAGKPSEAQEESDDEDLDDDFDDWRFR